MRRVTLAFCFMLACGLVLTRSVGTARAQDIEVEEPKFRADYRDDQGKEHSKVFNLANAEQRAELKKLIDNQRVFRLVQEEPINILAMSKELGIWTLVVFVLLFWILSKVAWKPMLEGLRKREENIHGALADAQKARDEAKDVENKVKQRLDQIGEEIRSLMDDARRKAESLAADMTAKARQEIQGDRDRLLREIGQEKDKALKELLDHTAQLATLVSAKTIRRQLSPEDHRRLVDEALTELRNVRPNGTAKAVV